MDRSNPLHVADQEVGVRAEHFLQHMGIRVAGSQVNHGELPSKME